MRRLVILAALLAVGAMSTVLGAAFAGGRATASQQPPSAADIRVHKISDNLFMLAGGGGNTAAFVTIDGVVLVDTKLPGSGRLILDKLKELTQKPVTTIINTHTHFDHVGGNVEFPAPIEVFAHEATAKLMQEMRPVTAGPAQPNVFKDSNGHGLPTRTFKDRLTLGTGDERIELYFFGRGHTGGDAFVVFPVLRVLHTGDAFGNKTIPIIDANNGGSGIEYADTLAKAAALPNIATVITGHYPTILTIRDVKMYADFNREFVQDMQAAKKGGRTIDEVVNSWKVPDRFLEDGYLTPEEYQKLTRQPMTSRLRANVEVVWNETK